MRPMQLTSYDIRGLIDHRWFKKIPPIPAICQFQMGQPLPNFTLPDADRHPHTLASYRGKPVVLVFVRLFGQKQYRPDRYPYLSALSAAHSQFVGLGAELLTITSTNTKHSKTAQQGLSLNMPLLVDPSGQTFRAYGTGQALGAPLPAQFVIDPDGQLRFQHLFSFAHPKATPERLLWAVRTL